MGTEIGTASFRAWPRSSGRGLKWGRQAAQSLGEQPAPGGVISAVEMAPGPVGPSQDAVGRPRPS